MGEAAKNLDLSKLSQREKLELLDLLEEQERRTRERRASYVPNPGQSRVHESLAKVRCVFSGNGAGKTTLLVHEVLWLALGYNPVTKKHTHVPARIAVVLDHPEKADQVFLEELKKWYSLKPDQIHKRGKHHTSALTFDNGSEVLFFSHSQDPLTFESLEISAAAMDEPPPRFIWVGLRRAGRSKNTDARYLIVGTPIAQSWMRTELLIPWQKGESPEVECFTFGTDTNSKNLADGYIEGFSKILSEKERRIRLHGEFYDLDGLALAHLFDPMVHEIAAFAWPEENACVVAIDPHTSKPHHAILLGCDKEGQLYYIKELKEKMVARDFARRLKQWYKGFRLVDIVYDSLGSSEYTSGEGFKSFGQVLNEEGVRARPTSFDEKSDEDWIQRIQDALVIPEEPNNFGEKIPKLRIFSGNPGIVGDISNVIWTKHKNIEEFKPKLDITNKDYLSCLKYALATNLTPNKDKAAVYRRLNIPATYVGRETSQRRSQNLKLQMKGRR